MVKDDEKEVKIVKDDASVEAEEKKAKSIAEESESQKPVVVKERNIDLHLDLEKSERDSGTGSLTGNKLHQQGQRQQAQPPLTVPEKTGNIKVLSSINFSFLLYFFFFFFFLWEDFRSLQFAWLVYLPIYIFSFTAQSNSLPLPLSVASWPGGLPPMGYGWVIQFPINALLLIGNVYSCFTCWSPEK